MHRLFTSASKNIHPVGLSLSNFSVFEKERSLHIKQIIMLLQVVLGVTFSDGWGYIIELLVKMLTGFLSVDWWTLLRSGLNVLSGSPRIKKEGGWAFSGWDSSLPMQVTWVRALVRELDPTCHNKDWSSCVSQLRPSTAKWIIKKRARRRWSCTPYPRQALSPFTIHFFSPLPKWATPSWATSTSNQTLQSVGLWDTEISSYLQAPETLDLEEILQFCFYDFCFLGSYFAWC